MKITKFKLIYYQIFHCILFLLGYYILLIPIVKVLYNLFCKNKNYNVLVNSQILELITSPYGVLLLLFIIGIATICIFFEIGGLTYIQLEYKDSKSLWKLYGNMIKVFRNSLDSKSYKLLLYFIIITPALGLVHTEFVQRIVMPIFIKDFLVQFKIGIISISFIYGIIMLYGIKWMFALHILIEKKVNIKEAFSQSVERYKKIPKLEIIYMIMIYFLAVMFINIIREAFSLIDHVFIFYTLKAFIFKVAMPLAYVNFVGKLYMEERVFSKPNISLKKIAIVTVIAVLILGSLGGEITNNLEKKNNYIAHRGGSSHAENTLSAIEDSYKNGIKNIEIDIRYTKDDVFVLFHDKTLFRVNGKFNKIEDLTYSELKTYNIGELYSGEKIEKITTLEEVIQKYGNNIYYNIELKFNDKDKSRMLVSMLEKYDLLDNSRIISTDYAALKYIEEIKKEIKTGIIIWASIGKIEKLDIDCVLVEQSNIDGNLVKAIHDTGRPIYAWTVNNTKKVNQLLDMGIDGVITDNYANISLGHFSWFKNFIYNLKESIPIFS